MRFPDRRPREDDFDEVARAILAGIAGAITGAMVMLAAVHLPILVFQLHGDEAGGLVLALGFWGLPAGFIGGIIAGVFARRYFGGIAVAVAMVVSVIVSPIVVTAAEDVAMRVPKYVSPDGCVNRGDHTIDRKSVVAIYTRACPGRTKTIHANVLQDVRSIDSMGDGNALVLAAKGNDKLDSLDVLVVRAPDSVIALRYDSRLSVVRLTPRVGAFTIEALPRTHAQLRQMSAAPGPSPLTSGDSPGAHP